MVAIARNQHFIPQGYLAGFTNTGTRKGKLYVFDLKIASTFSTIPRNIAARRDFNRIEIDGVNPDVLEKHLGEFEGKATLAIRKVARENKLFDGDVTYSYIINLICLLVIRNPKTRRSLTNGKQQLVQTIADTLASGKGIWEHHQRKAREAGYYSGPDISFDQIKEVVDDRKYTIEVPRNSLIRIELSIFDNVLKFLGRRFWSLLSAAPGAPDFITCDHPVTLAFKDAKTKGPIGIGLRQTELVVPITARHALLGVY